MESFNSRKRQEKRVIKKVYDLLGQPSYMYIDWRLVRRRVTRRLTRLQTMCNDIKYCKISKNGSLRLRLGCGWVAFFVSIYLYSVL